MLKTFVSTSFFGRTVYHLSGHKYFTYKEESPEYIIPDKYIEKLTDETEDNQNGSKAETSSVASETRREIIVDWDSEDDPENPYNWPLPQKIIIILMLCMLTVSVYMGSSIYTPGATELMEEFGISNTVASLPLSMFVFGYAIGPMIFSPLSENAEIGRTKIYIATLFLFVILQIPIALVHNIAGLCILRFITGFFSSPILSTGGASVGDIITLPYIPVGISCWSIAGICGPSLGPLIGAAMTIAGGWRWTFWMLLILSGASLIALIFFMPETSTKTILYRKAKRLRARTNNEFIISEAELENRNKQWKQIAFETLWRPIEVMVSEPVVMLIDVYLGLVYAIMYLWFEAFPIVFVEVHHFTLMEMGVTYISIFLGIVASAFFYIPFILKTYTKRMLKGDTIEPEVFLPLSIAGSVLMPIGILIFAWSSSPDIHWIGPLFGAGIFAGGAFFVFQTLLNYLSYSFFRFIASVFAGNTLARSGFAGAFPLFGRPLFINLGSERFPVGWGSTLLALICVAMILIPVVFYMNGPKLRARSKYAGSG